MEKRCIIGNSWVIAADNIDRGQRKDTFMSVGRPSLPVQGSEQVTTIIDEGQRYHPLGSRINKLDYEIPEWFENEEEVVAYLTKTREELADGKDVQKIADRFWQELGLSTANMASFKERRNIWGDFQDTYEKIAAGLLGSGDSQAHDFNATGFRKAADFLRPLAYIPTSKDSDFVWGYITPSVDKSVPANPPPRCQSLDSEMDATKVLIELKRDLIKSFEKRLSYNPRSQARDQCFEPEHPVRFRAGTSVDGPESVPEGEGFQLSSDDVSKLEYGKGFGNTRDVPANEDWIVSQYTCEEPPSIKADGPIADVKVPAVFRDCVAEFKRRLRPPNGPEVSAVKTVEILNTVNEGPEVRIVQKKNSKDGDIVLFADASDQNGDALKYKWEQVGGPVVHIIGKSDGQTIQFRQVAEDPFRMPAAEKIDAAVTFRVTVTDEPTGKMPGPAKCAQATHKVALKTEKGGAFSPDQLDARKKGVTDLVLQGGETPEFAAPKDLIDKLIDAVTPEKVVESNDVMLLFDTSGSMQDNIERTQREMARVLEQMRLKVKGGDISRVRMGIASYVDNEYIVYLPLSPVDVSRIRSSLQEVIKRTEKGGSLENVWDALYLTLDGQKWKEGEDTTRKLVYITDEPGDIGKLGKTKKDVDKISAEKKVKVDAVFIEDGESEYYPKLGNLEISYNKALSIPGEKDRIEFIKKDYFPRYKELAENYGWREDGHTSYNMHPSKIRDQFPRLLDTINDPETRFKLAEELLVPLIQNKDKWATYSAYELFGGAILGLGDAKKRLELGRKWLSDIGVFMKGESEKGYKPGDPPLPKRAIHNFARDLIVSTPAEKDRIDFIRNEYFPIVSGDAYWDPETNTDIEKVFGTIRDPRKRLALAEELSLPMQGKSKNAKDVIKYGHVVLTHPDEQERLRLGRKVLLENSQPPEVKRAYAFSLAMSMSGETLRTKVLNEDFLPFFGKSGIDDRGRQNDPFALGHSVDDLASILKTLGDRALKKKIADQYILPLTHGKDGVAANAWLQYKELTGEEPKP